MTIAPSPSPAAEQTTTTRHARAQAAAAPPGDDHRPPPASRRGADVTATLIARLERAWNAADGAAFGAWFTDDADFVDVRGDHHHGRAAIAAGHQAIFDTIYRGSTVRYAVERTRQLRPDVTIAVVGAQLDVPGGPLAGRRRARFTTVVVDRDGAPAVTSFHNTLLAADG